MAAQEAQNHIQILIKDKAVDVAACLRQICLPAPAWPKCLTLQSEYDFERKKRVARNKLD